MMRKIARHSEFYLIWPHLYNIQRHEKWINKNKNKDCSYLGCSYWWRSLQQAIWSVGSIQFISERGLHECGQFGKIHWILHFSAWVLFPFPRWRCVYWPFPLSWTSRGLHTPTGSCATCIPSCLAEQYSQQPTSACSSSPQEDYRGSFMNSSWVSSPELLIAEFQEGAQVCTFIYISSRHSGWWRQLTEVTSDPPTHSNPVS